MAAVSAVQVAVSVSTRHDGPVADVWLTGDIDLAAEAALAEAAEELRVLAPRSVMIDLAGVTFAGTSLVSFLVRVRTVIPGGASMTTRGPIPLVRRVLIVTAVDQLVGLDLAADA